MDYVAIAVAVIAALAAVVAYKALREQRWTSMVTSNYASFSESYRMLWEKPDLLALHNIDQHLLTECDATREEIIYLLADFSAGNQWSRLEKAKSEVLTKYRKNMLDNPKVALIWTSVLYRRLMIKTPFTDAVNEYIEAKPSQAGQSSV